MAARQQQQHQRFGGGGEPPSPNNSNNNNNNHSMVSVQHARNYVARVKHALGPSSPQYRLFLSTLKGYRTQELPPQEVINRISNLFRGQRELILGFNAFLPEEYQIVDDRRPPGAPALAVVPIFDEYNPVREVLVPNNAQPEPPAGDDEDAVNMDVDDKSDDDEEEEEVDNNSSRRYRQEERAAAQDPSPQPRRKRLRVRVTSSKSISKNIKVTTRRPAAAPAATSINAINHNNNNNNNKLNSSITQIVLSPPKVQPSDLLHDHIDKDGEFNYNINTDHVNCKLCKGRKRNFIISQEGDEPVLLCEQRGCNAEYHLGCLYNVRPSLFPNKNNKDKNNSNGVSDNDDVNNMDTGGNDNNGPLEVPEGDIFCTKCFTHGATSVLEKYFDKIDYERSHYSCSRAYVTSLLEKHMRENPDGNVADVVEVGSGGEEVRLRCSPRSELWYARELICQALDNKDDDTMQAQGDGGLVENSNNNSSSAEFLVGKPVRLYNNLDNEYHVGRIVDWRTCTVYPPLYDKNDSGPSVSKNNTVQMKDLEYYGIGPISTSEYLVRFPAGLQGRKKELLRWIVLEEHSIAVGVSLIQGKTAKLKGGSVKGWKPAMVLARSALELVTVRQFLHEDDDGHLFAEMKGGGDGGGGYGVDDRWALASFFGEEQHALLHLRDEARDLLVDVVTDVETVNGGDNGELNKEATKADERASDETVQASPTAEEETLFRREPLASVDVPLGLALAEHSEQARCKEWCKLILKKSAHEHALVSFDEYSLELNLEREKAVTHVQNGSKQAGETILANSQSDHTEPGATNNKSIRPLVERGMDRLWLAHLVEKVSHQPIQRSKDTLMSFKCQNVSSVSDAMASLQRL
ncbi:hypothetical protein ACHAXR_004302 [Thalassiosira sp. AJA248-18]